MERREWLVLYLYVGEHIKPKQSCGETFYSATITLVPPVALVLDGWLPLYPLSNIHVLLHSRWHPLSFEQIPLIQIYQINHIFIKTINFQLFLLTWKNIKAFHYYPFAQQYLFVVLPHNFFPSLFLIPIKILWA